MVDRNSMADADDHTCRGNIDWRPEDADRSGPVPGVCEVCDEPHGHYCDDHWPRDGDLELVDHHRHTDVPIYGIEYDCPVCGRELELRFKKEGTFEKRTGEMVYGP